MSRPAAELSTVDQIVFGHGPDGVAAMRSSLDSAHQAAVWDQRLLPLARLEAFSGNPAPAQSLSYFGFGKDVAVLRRVDSGRTNGRNVAHALVGSPQVLGPFRALALRDWPDWVDEVLDETTVHALDGHTLPAGPEPALIRPDLLRVLVAATLRAPSPHLTVIGAPQEQPVPLVQGLLELLSPLFAGSDRERHWTFSGYEREVSASCKNAAEITFMPVFHEGVTTTAGKVVDLASDDAGDDWVAEVARRLVSQYFAEGRQTVAAEIEAASATRPTSFERRLDALRAHYVDEPAASLVPQQLTPQAEQPDPVRATPAETGPGTTHGLPQPSAGRSSEQPSEHRLLVTRLRQVQRPAEVREVVGRFTELGPAGRSSERRWVRTQLLSEAFLDGRLDELGRSDGRIYPVVVRQSFGGELQDVRREDLPALTELGRLVSRHQTSPFLIRELLDQAAAAKKAELLLAAYGLREMRNHGLLVADPVWAAHFCPDPGRHRPAPGPSGAGNDWAAPGVPPGRAVLENWLVVVVTLVLAFVLGLVVGVVNIG